MRVFLFVAAVLLATAALTGDLETKGTEMEETVRRPAVAGQFYQADPSALRSEVEGFIAGASPERIKGDIVALISPHAGYIYSGPVAAWGYSLLKKGQFETVIVISPSHVEYFPFASVFDGDAYSTPLGRIDVDRELAAEIAAGGDRIELSRRGHISSPGKRGEHALEVQLPFLQIALGDFRLVPIVMGDQSREVIEQLGESIGRSIASRNVLVVASTDLSHFHDRSSASRLDGEFIMEIEAMDVDGLLSALASGETEACGGGPAASAMIAARARGPVRCKVLRYAESGDITGDTENVVGYVSAVITSVEDVDAKKETAGSKSEDTGKGDEETEGDISRDERIFLLRLARHVISNAAGIKSEKPEMLDSGVLEEKRGGFVTLRKKGRLRGCIGYISAVKPLVETIEEMAYAAAFRDTRFPPVKAEELPELTIEISVLSPVRVIDDPSVIEVGKHGIILTRGDRSGLLLPQVAVEYGWDRETFLDQTCIKAGLPLGAWRDKDTRIEIFSAEVFSEEELGLR